MWEWTERKESPHWSTMFLGRSYVYWVGALAGMSWINFSSPWYLAIAISSTAMLGIYLASSRMGLDARRVLVDAALLSPLLFLG